MSSGSKTTIPDADSTKPVQGMSCEDDPLIRLLGSGRDTWADEHADAYIDRLRDEDSQ